jgi:hypothetical protein
VSIAVPSLLCARAVVVAGALTVVHLVWGSTYAALRAMVVAGSIVAFAAGAWLLGEVPPQRGSR